MSEHRYGVHDCPNGFYYLRDVTDHSVYVHRNYGKLYSEYKDDIELVSSLLNELADKIDDQQDLIDKLKKDIQVYENTFRFLCYSDNVQMEKKILEQQNTIKQLKEENEQLRKYNGQLKERLERINGGYGHLTHRNGLTANEWLIESQEKELKKKNEQISDWIERHSKDIEKISEQQNTISQLEEENEQLRQMIKENVFGRYVEGSLADLEFKAIAYDDIIKLEIPNESEPKLIVTCKPGKVENVKSFCQMFIPFEMYYEIKELEDE